MLGQDWDKTQFLPGNWRFASGNNGLSISDINWWDIEQHLQSCTRGQRRQGCGVSAMRSSLPCLLLLTSLPGVLVRPTMSWTILTRLAAIQWRADCQPGCHGKVFQIVKNDSFKCQRWFAKGGGGILGQTWKPANCERKKAFVGPVEEAICTGTPEIYTDFNFKRPYLCTGRSTWKVEVFWPRPTISDPRDTWDPGWVR